MTATPAAPRLRSVHRQMRFATPRVVGAMVVREMATTYGRKPFGYVWTIVEPIAGIALMSWIFVAMGIRHPALGTNFPIFYATGFLPFTLYTAISGKLSQALSYSRSLLAYPRVTVIDALLARFIVHLMTQLLVSYIVILGIRSYWNTGTQVVIEHIVLGFAMAAALAVGVGTLNCYLTSRFPLWGTAWSVAMRPLVIVSGVIVLVDRLPPAWLDLLTWNPLVHVVAEVRKGFYHGYSPSYISPAYVFGFALVTGVVGLLFLWRTHRDILER
jgi:capsular polysaccharide transport system permease protein